MTYYEKIKQLYDKYAKEVPQKPYDEATKLIAEEMGMEPKMVFWTMLSHEFNHL